MAYYLTYEKKRGEHQIIDITKSYIFPKESRYSKPGACSLKEIDLYTSTFKDEQELKRYLLLENLITSEVTTKKISIREIRDNKYVKVMYDLLYQDDLNYIALPELIIKYYKNAERKGNYLLLKKLAQAFQNYYGCNVTASDLLNYSETSMMKGFRYNHFDDLDHEGYNVTERLLRMLIYVHHQLPNGNILYEEKVNYRNLHKLIAFKNLQKKKNVIIEENSQPKQQPPSKIKSKKKKYDIPGQISLFENENSN